MLGARLNTRAQHDRATSQSLGRTLRGSLPNWTHGSHSRYYGYARVERRHYHGDVHTKYDDRSTCSMSIVHERKTKHTSMCFVPTLLHSSYSSMLNILPLLPSLHEGQS